MKRACGDCIVCCVYLKIDGDDMQKAPMVHCPHLSLPGPIEENIAYYTGSCGSNCRVRDTGGRAKVCWEYECLWLQGYGDEEDRPDKSLMLFDRAPHIENAIHAKPVADGKEKMPEGMELIKKMSRLIQKPVIVIDFYKRGIRQVIGRPVANKH
jgi:hypothetical protein